MKEKPVSLNKLLQLTTPREQWEDPDAAEYLLNPPFPYSIKAFDARFLGAIRSDSRHSAKNPVSASES
jgi:hypothetical protein